MHAIVGLPGDSQMVHAPEETVSVANEVEEQSWLKDFYGKKPHAIRGAASGRPMLEWGSHQRWDLLGKLALRRRRGMVVLKGTTNLAMAPNTGCSTRGYDMVCVPMRAVEKGLRVVHLQSKECVA